MTDALLALWRLVRRFPAVGWGVQACAIAVGCWWLVASYGGAQYEAGRRSVTATLAPSGVDTVVRIVERQAEARTDTVVKRVLVTVKQVDTLVQNLPDSVQMRPDVSKIVEKTYTLAAQVDTLVRVIDTERAAHHLRASVDSAQIVALKVTNAGLVRENMTLAKRPRWRTVALGVLTGAVVGVLK
jgi:hypothetical protein